MIGDKQTDDAALKANVEKIFLLSNNKDKNQDKNQTIFQLMSLMKFSISVKTINLIY